MRCLPLLLLSALLPAQERVRTGIDVLQKRDHAPLAGKRIGLVTNHTGLDGRGRRTVDVLHDAANVDLTALFSPEHGFEGTLDQSRIADATDTGTGLEVFSLYGETRRPTDEMLEDLDALVFDIQDIGCRFYTYVSTMGLCMDACAEKGLTFFVLDRPNPIGGDVVAGPVRDEDQESFVSFHDIPVRHGMTVGELALLMQKERWPDLDLHVVEVEGWKRSGTWDRTGLLWVNPSPNMRCLTQALLYPGIGLVEGTNVSVGRGTDTPFEVVGAPWIDPWELAAELNGRGLPGVRFVPVRFTPESSKHRGTECGGVDIAITDWEHFQSVRTGIHLAHALRTLFPDDWEPERYRWLLRDEATYRALLAGKDPDAIVSSWQGELEDFAERRQAVLLYP